MYMYWKHITFVSILGLSLGGASTLQGQTVLEVTAQIRTAPARPGNPSQREGNSPPAAAWLSPLSPVKVAPLSATGNYTLLQKNKQFSPHVLVVPVGAAVHFPNADPFFHNVFSLFDGRRFDLGLYEAGTSKEVTFGREGISYIFCNIHPEMSAVVIAVSTPYYSVAGPRGQVRIEEVPSGEYMLHIWVQGQDQTTLDRFQRRVHISPDHTDLGEIALPPSPSPPQQHKNKFGKTYDTREIPVY